MIEIPIIALMLFCMCIVGVILFTYEYGKQVRELKELKRKVRERDIELTYERFRENIGQTTRKQLLDSEVFEKAKRKK
tara:strand:- start:4643 stop:4876 length:234 start_codon:yes stop_codon:yes gene_type:complete